MMEALLLPRNFSEQAPNTEFDMTSLPENIQRDKSTLEGQTAVMYTSGALNSDNDPHSLSSVSERDVPILLKVLGQLRRGSRPQLKWEMSHQTQVVGIAVQNNGLFLPFPA